MDEQIYHVDANGGTPQRFITDLGSMATVSPDGNLVAYVKGVCRISREDYTGSAQRDVWIYNIKNGSYFQVTSSKKNDHSLFGMQKVIYITLVLKVVDTTFINNL